MKRLLALSSLVALTIALGLQPVGAQGVSTFLSTQENVRHITTVPGNTGGHVVVEGNRLYMGNYGTGLTAYDITNPRNPVKIGQYLPGPSASDGADPGLRTDAPPDAAVWNGRHIVSLGGTNRVANRIQTEFLDFTNPASPQLLWRMLGTNDRESHNGDIVDARKLWLPSGGSGNDGLRIYDMSPLLQTPPAAPVKLFAGNPHTLWLASPYKSFHSKPNGGSFNHTHDIEIYTDREILLPEWEWEDQDGDGVEDPTWGLRDIALLAAAGGGNVSGAVYAIDITDPSAPVVISKWQNPSGAGSTPIGYLHEAQFLDGDPNTVYVADETMTSGCEFGRIYTYNISDDLAHTQKLAEWTIGEGYQDAPACAGAHVFSSKDQHLFMGAYVAGLQVLDLRDPAAPKRAGRYIAEGMNSWGALAAKGLVYVGDFGGRGLDVFEFIQDPIAKDIVKAANPATRTTGGIAETGCRQADPFGPTNGTDGLIVNIPAYAQDGNHVLKAYGSSQAPYDLDIWFHTGTACTSMGYAGGNDSTDAVEPIPEGAEMASIDLYLGATQWVYVQVVPAG